MRRQLFPVLTSVLLIGGLVAVDATSAKGRPQVLLGRQAENKLKQLGLASQNYHDTYGVLQGNILDTEGKPLLSWRVALLPFIEETALYNQFKLDEPWDSEHNKKLIEQMPKLYAPVRVKAKPGETYLQMFTGEHTLNDPKRKKGYSLVDITALNGTSNTGMIFEAGDPVIWTKPADLLLVKDKPLPKLGGLFDGDYHVVFCDGHVQFLKKNIDEEQLRCMIDPTNIMPFDLDKKKP